MTKVVARATMPPSLEVIPRALAAEDAYTSARRKVRERIAGNPIGVAYRAPESEVWHELEARLDAVRAIPGDVRRVPGKTRILATSGFTLDLLCIKRG